MPGNATAETQLAAGAGTAAGDPNDIVADPNDLDLYELLLPRCVLARLDPINYVSYPARPFVSIVLSYSGRRLPHVLYEVAEPLLACAAGRDLPPWPGPEDGSGGGGGVGGGGAAAAGDGSSGGGGGAAGGKGPLNEPVFLPLPLEILVAFDEVSEAAGWAAAAADSGGRIIPVFRPGVADVSVSGSSNGTSGSSKTGSSSNRGTGRSAGSPPPLVHWANRVAQLAQGEILVVVQVRARCKVLGSAGGRVREREGLRGGSCDKAQSTSSCLHVCRVFAARWRRVTLCIHHTIWRRTLVVVCGSQDGDSLLSPLGPEGASGGTGSSTSARVCSWLHVALRTFEAWPQLGALGSGAYVMDWHPAAINRGQHFW